MGNEFMVLIKMQWAKKALQWLVSAFVSTLLLCPLSVLATQTRSIDQLLTDLHHSFKSDLPKTEQIFTQLKPYHRQFNQTQQATFTLHRGTFLGLIGKHQEQVALLRKVLADVVDNEARAKYYYQLSGAYSQLDDYQQAFSTLNQAMALLSSVTDAAVKTLMFQTTVTLLIALDVLDEADVYATKLYQLGVSVDDNNTICKGLAHKVTIQFKMGNTDGAHSALAQTLKICGQSRYPLMAATLRAVAAVNLIDNGQFVEGLSQALNVLETFNLNYKDAEQISMLEEAIARGYLQGLEFNKASRYAVQAYQHAASEQSKDTLIKASKTLADIKQATGQLAQALSYQKVYFGEKTMAEQQRFARKMAYQQVKYGNLDKTNQLALIKFKRNSLSLNQKLQQRNNDNLVLVVSLATVLLIFMSILLVLSLKKKQVVMYDAAGELHRDARINGALDGSVDGMPYVAKAFDESRLKQSRFSIILFELDFLAGYDRLLDDIAGHALLREVNHVCNGQIRQLDQFGRISEHQFVICLLESTSDGAIAIAERCHQLIGQISVDCDDIPTPIETTFGIAMISDSFADYNESLAAADRALQQARELDDGYLSVYHEDE